MAPLVSILIPNFNHEAYLRERIDSVLAQTFTDYEVIVLDDCSTDGSRTVIESYEDRLDRVIYNESNSGSPFIQWKKGIELASGEYIWIAESDDVAEPVFLEKMVDAFKSDPELSFAFCRSENIDSSGTSLGLHPSQAAMNDELSMPGDEFIKRFLTVGNKVVNASSVLFRKACADFGGVSFIDFKGSGDWLFWIELARKGNVAYSPVVLNHFRQHGDNVTHMMQSSGKSLPENMRVSSYLRDLGYLSARKYLSTRIYWTYQIKYKLSVPSPRKKELYRAVEAGCVLKMLAVCKYYFRKICRKSV